MRRGQGRALDMASMAERNSGLGATVGLSEDSSTALVYRSSVRKHTSFSPNCCSRVSPCAAGFMVGSSQGRVSRIPRGAQRPAGCAPRGVCSLPCVLPCAPRAVRVLQRDLAQCAAACRLRAARRAQSALHSGVRFL